MSRFTQLFPGRAPVIGMISLPPLPGYPAFESIDHLVACALADLEALEQGGAAGVLVENDFDRPHTLTGAPEIIAAMTRVTHAVVTHARIPVGVQVLLNDWRASLAIAAATGAQFVRLDFFVDRVRINAGLIEPEPQAVLAYRSAIRAEWITLLTDLQVKYSTLADGPKPLEQSAYEATTAGSDALIITGPATGIGPTTIDLQSARTGGLPILIGSGLTPETAPVLGPLADGAIVGTALRSGPTAADRVIVSQVRRMVVAFEETRD